MASKVQERIYAEAAANLLKANWLLMDIPEPPDFEVQNGAEKFGLEIRHVFVDTETSFGSPSKRSESKNVQLVSALAKQYYAAGGSPISAKLLGVLSMVDLQALAKCMVADAPRYPGANVAFEAHNMKVFMTPLPAAWFDYSRWAYVDDKVGWLRQVTETDLQNAVNRKQANLPLYKKMHENTELLLVADRTFNSGKLVEAHHLAVSNPGFRAIYFMSYPESIQRVG